MAAPPERLSIRYLRGVALFWCRKSIPVRAVMSSNRGGSAAASPTQRIAAELPAAQSPIFIEESGGDDLPRITVVGRGGGVHHGVIGNLGDLPRVVQVIVFAESEAAVQHNILLRIQRIRIDQNRRVLIGGEFLRAD